MKTLSASVHKWTLPVSNLKKNQSIQQTTKKNYCRSLYFYQLLKLPVGTLIFCQSDPCPSRYKTQGGTREQVSKSSFSRHCLHFILSLCSHGGIWLSAAFSLCFHLAPASSCRFPALCHVPVPTSAWKFIFLLVALQPHLTAVINGFDICLISSLALSGSLKGALWNIYPLPYPLVDAWLQNMHCSVELPSFPHTMWNN